MTWKFAPNSRAFAGPVSRGIFWSYRILVGGLQSTKNWGERGNLAIFFNMTWKQLWNSKSTNLTSKNVLVTTSDPKTPCRNLYLHHAICEILSLPKNSKSPWCTVTITWDKFGEFRDNFQFRQTQTDAFYLYKLNEKFRDFGDNLQIRQTQTKNRRVWKSSPILPIGSLASLGIISNFSKLIHSLHIFCEFGDKVGEFGDHLQPCLRNKRFIAFFPAKMRWNAFFLHQKCDETLVAKTRLAKGWRKVGERLAKGWRKVGERLDMISKLANLLSKLAKKNAELMSLEKWEIIPKLAKLPIEFGKIGDWRNWRLSPNSATFVWQIGDYLQSRQTSP